MTTQKQSIIPHILSCATGLRLYERVLFLRSLFSCNPDRSGGVRLWCDEIPRLHCVSLGNTGKICKRIFVRAIASLHERGLSRVAVVLCVLAVLAPAPAHAVNGALMTGKALASLCSSKEEKDLFSCQTYIAGVIDYHRLIRGLGVVPSVDFCLPDALTMDQVRRIVYAYTVRHSEHHDFIAAPAVAMSLYQRYPCARRKR